MNMSRILLYLIAAAAIAAAGPAYAQRTPPASPYDDARGIDNPNRDDAATEAKREEIRKKIEAVRIWRLTEELKLDANASAKLSSILSSVQQQRRDILREQMALLDEMKSSLKPAKPDESKLKALLEKIEKNRHAFQELRAREFNAVKEVLTIEQQARFLIFQQEFRRDMRGMISGARGGKGPGRGPGPDRGQMREDTARPPAD